MTTQAVATRPADTLAALIDRMKPEIARALPSHMSPDRLARIATTVMRQTPLLGQATPASFLGALMTCAQLGLEPGPLGHVYLLPFKNHARNCRDRKGCGCPVDVQLIVGYRGLIDLVRRSGKVASVKAYVVREGDEFDYRYGLDPNLYHRPKAAVDAPVTHVYSVVRYIDGGEPEFEVMTIDEVASIRRRSRAADNGPWVSDFAEMAKKTVLRRHLKTVPMSVEYATAVAQDGAVRTDITAAIDALPAAPVDDEILAIASTPTLADLDEAKEAELSDAEVDESMTYDGQE